MILKNDPLFTKITNLLMKHGKRSKAEKVLSKALRVIDKKYSGNSSHILYLAAAAVKQDVAVRIKPKPRKRRKVQTFNVYLPRIVSPQRGLNLGLRSLVVESRKNSRTSSLPLSESLSLEIVKAAQNSGPVVQKRYNTNKLAIANKRRLHLSLI